jgi:hypothetical protein
MATSSDVGLSKRQRTPGFGRTILRSPENQFRKRKGKGKGKKERRGCRVLVTCATRREEKKIQKNLNFSKIVTFSRRLMGWLAQRSWACNIASYIAETSFPNAPTGVR